MGSKLKGEILRGEVGVGRGKKEKEKGMQGEREKGGAKKVEGKGIMKWGGEGEGR